MLYSSGVIQYLQVYFLKTKLNIPNDEIKPNIVSPILVFEFCVHN